VICLTGILSVAVCQEQGLADRQPVEKLNFSCGRLFLTRKPFSIRPLTFTALRFLNRDGVMDVIRWLVTTQILCVVNKMEGLTTVIGQ
jgi:hypothetical protein